MAHNITATDGLVLAGKGAWHGLGVVLPERCSAMDALHHAKMDWTVESAPITATMADGRAISCPEHRMLVRSDTGEAFAAVGSKYSTIQWRELAEFVDEITGQSQYAVETAGTILGGRKGWFLLDAGEVVAAADDKSKAYYLIGSSHDGSMPVTLGAVGKRVVCNNTFTIALSELGDDTFRVRHTRNAKTRLGSVAALLSGATEAMDGYRNAVRRMAETPIDREQLQAYFSGVWQRVNGALVSRPVGQQPSRRENRFVQEVAGWMDNFFNDHRQTGQSTSGTVWAALNSVTQWVNHDRTVREESSDSSRRTDAVLFGTGAAVSKVAYDAAVRLVTA